MRSTLLALALILPMLIAQSQYLAESGKKSPAIFHPVFKAAHCDVEHRNGKAHAGYVYHLPSGLIQTSWWNEYVMQDGQYATKSEDAETITVKIRQRTPYNTYVTVASKHCSGGF